MDQVLLHRCSRQRWLRLGRSCTCDQAEDVLIEHGVDYAPRRYPVPRSAHNAAFASAAYLVPRLELKRGFIVAGLGRISTWSPR